MLGRLCGRAARQQPPIVSASTATTTAPSSSRSRPRQDRPPCADPPRRHKHTSPWMQRHVRDPYVRAAKKDDLRSRAAFKLKEMQEKCRLIRRGDVVVDIGCAPGGWAELTAALVRGDKKGTGTGAGARGNRGGRVVGIDLLPVQPPVPGATLLQGDFTDPKSRAELLRLATAPLVDGGRPARVDVVLSDVAPNFSGDAYTDHVRTLQLCYEVFDFAAEAFSGPAAESEGGGGDAGIQEAAAAAATPGGRGRDKGAPRGGAVLCKLLKGQDEQAFLAHVRASYADVRLLKPKASRAESSEMYVLARGFRGGGAGGTDASSSDGGEEG